ncbi:antibiotic biosynthesis monooxygenase [Streptomyces sp. VRA16 Mangrove soil]|uniref:antibiotic biosynthesis monooxygenase family protein n=1 Tax=Streptomyces sp. VRA16 Mangrove soil TaxID=2817434 RepID=UPI001A9D539F|nr:antibiotic biosynthesis monooxygenase [Streptomyces sp. VRA16 Mangrove soil]
MYEMFTVMNRIPVPAAAADGFEEQFGASMGQHLADVAGLLSARLLRPQNESGVYVAVMDFASKEAFSAWMQSLSFRAAHQSSPGMAGEIESFETVVAVGA